MEKDSIMSNKYIFILSVPIFIELFMQVLVNNVDQIMLSQLPKDVSDIYVNAVGQTNTVLNVFIMFFSVFSAASIILISQYKGAKDKERENRVYTMALVINIVFSIVIGIVLVLFCRHFFMWMQVDDKVLDSACTYMRINAIFIILPSLITLFSGFLRSNELMMQSLAISILVNILNIIFNALLINGLTINGINIIPRLELTGAALGSVFARLIGVIILIYLIIKKANIHIKLKASSKETLKKIFQVGLPSGGEALSYNVSQIVILIIINLIARKENDLSIANTKMYVYILANITYLFASAFSQGMQIIIGRLLGARRIEDAENRVWYTVKSSYFVSTAISIFMFIFSYQVLGIFTDNQAILELGRQILFVEIFLEMGRAFNIVLVRALQTSGDIMFPTTTAIIFCWAVAVLGSYFFGYVLGMGLIGVWIAMTLDEIFRAIIFCIRFKKGKWREIELI